MQCEEVKPLVQSLGACDILPRRAVIDSSVCVSVKPRLTCSDGVEGDVIDKLL